MYIRALLGNVTGVPEQRHARTAARFFTARYEVSGDGY
jgi:hypothetical protein